MIGVLVTISENYLKILSKWASVSRTLNTARAACDDIQEMDNLVANIQEKYQHCSHELEVLTPALDNMHQIIRSKLWQVDDPGTQFFGVYLITNDNEEAMPVAIGMAISGESIASKCDQVFDISKFYTEVLTRDQFEHLCQERKVPIFP